MIVRIEALILVMGLMLTGPAVAAKAPVLGEHLEYTLKYRGVVTGFVELDIAKMTMEVEQTMGKVDDNPAFVTNLQLTTEPYRKAEMLYPVRLHYRSWLDARKLNPIIAVKSLKTREYKEALLWFDHSQGEAYHYQSGELGGEETGKPPQSLQQITELPDEQWEKLLQTHRIAFGDTEALDYISFLHRLRSMPLKSGEQIDFSTFVLSLSTSALVNLGLAPDPATGQTGAPDLVMASQTIDTLALLQEKTRGNLDAEEDKLLGSLLYELRMRFVEVGQSSS